MRGKISYRKSLLKLITFMANIFPTFIQNALFSFAAPLTT
jgi:hypothetical protein